MPDHKAEQIMQAVTSSLAEKTEFVTKRAETDAIDKFPTVIVFMGGEDPIGDNGYDMAGFYDAELTIDFVIYVSSIIPETALNEVKALIHETITVLSVDGLVRIDLLGADEPELSNDGTATKAIQQVSYGFHYRTSVTDRRA